MRNEELQDFTGRLLPGVKEQLSDILAGYRAYGPDVVSGVEIDCGPDGCAAALKQQGAVYSLDSPPKLPLPGCDRFPCCACGYLPTLPENPEPARTPAAHKQTSATWAWIKAGLTFVLVLDAMVLLAAPVLNNLVQSDGIWALALGAWCLLALFFSAWACRTVYRRARRLRP